MARPLVHPDDKAKLEQMTLQLVDGPASSVLQLRNYNGTWALAHVTVYRIELDENAYAGLISARLPTPAELAAGLSGGPVAHHASARLPALLASRAHEQLLSGGRGSVPVLGNWFSAISAATCTQTGQARAVLVTE